MSEAAKRVQRFLAVRSQLSNMDPGSIQKVAAGGEEAELRAADLGVLLGIAQHHDTLTRNGDLLTMIARAVLRNVTATDNWCPDPPVFHGTYDQAERSAYHRTATDDCAAILNKQTEIDTDCDVRAHNSGSWEHMILHDIHRLLGHTDNAAQRESVVDAIALLVQMYHSLERKAGLPITQDLA